MVSFKEIQALKKPNETSIELVLEPDLTRTLAELYRRHSIEESRDKKLNRAALAPAIQKEIDALTDRIESAKVAFSFKDPGRKAFEDLIEACPPTEEEKKVSKDHGQPPPTWGTDTFVPGLLAMASLEPKLTLDDAREIYDEWGRGDVEALFNCALQACMETASIPFTRRDTDEILASVRSLITQQSEESPTDTS